MVSCLLIVYEFKVSIFLKFVLAIFLKIAYLYTLYHMEFINFSLMEGTRSIILHGKWCGGLLWLLTPSNL